MLNTVNPFSQLFYFPMVPGELLVKKALNEAKKKKPDLARVYPLLEKAALMGNGEALYAIGTWYLFGKYLKKNTKKAAQYFLMAGEKGHPAALYDLAVCYEKGVGVKKNGKKAFEYYLQAALSGDKEAIYDVGRCYYYGIGIGKNLKIANIWLRNAELHGVS